MLEVYALKKTANPFFCPHPSPKNTPNKQTTPKQHAINLKWLSVIHITQKISSSFLDLLALTYTRLFYLAAVLSVAEELNRKNF